METFHEQFMELKAKHRRQLRGFLAIQPHHRRAEETCLKWEKSAEGRSSSVSISNLWARPSLNVYLHLRKEDRLEDAILFMQDHFGGEDGLTENGQYVGMNTIEFDYYPNDTSLFVVQVHIIFPTDSLTCKAVETGTQPIYEMRCNGEVFQPST